MLLDDGCPFVRSINVSEKTTYCSCFNYAHSIVLLRNWDTSIHVSTEFCLAVTWVGLLVGNVWTFSGCSPADADCRSFCCSSLVRFRWSRTTSTTPFVCVELSERSKTKFLQPGHDKMFNQQRKELFPLEQFEIKSWGLLRCMFSTFTAHERLENALCVHLGCHEGWYITMISLPQISPWWKHRAHMGRW